MPSTLATLFPQVRAELLRLLFGGQGVRLHVRELARQSGLTLGTVQDELKKLTAAGLLVSQRDGNRLYYLANEQHPVFPDLRSLILKTSGLRDVLVAALAAVKGIDLAFIFGSLAADSARPGSDVDLMVLGTASLRTLAPHLRRASAELHREINPHALTPAEWSRRLKAHDVFIRRVSKEPKLWLKGDAHELGSLG
ncbi:MAG TPA: toxin-antitoxin system toxin subunit [Verrucomicrobiales bacterium]|nr:toxin-antitoxin system toxin subunit [Verrucomicrobiales bacterium]